MRIAVTGTSGFIGAHVAKALSSSGHELVAAVRPGGRPGPPGWEQVSLDIATEGHDPYRALGKPDVLLHLAWNGLPNYLAQRHLDEELPRQRHFLSACLEGGLRRVVVAGTCLEYGMREGQLAETLAPAPTTAYGEAKARLADDVRRRSEACDADATWLRLFYLFGPGQAPTSLYAQLQAAIDRGDHEFPMSPGDQQRDFQPVERAAAEIAKIVTGGTPRGTEIVNVCSGQAISVLNLVRKLVLERGSSIRPATGRYPYPSYEPFAAWGDRTRLDRLLERSDD